MQVMSMMSGPREQEEEEKEEDEEEEVEEEGDICWELAHIADVRD